MHAILSQGATWPSHERLAEVAGVNRRTVANVIGRHRAERLLVGGRPARLGPAMGLVVGLSLGSESLRGGIVDANGTLRHRFADDSTPGQLEHAPDAILRRLRAMAGRVLSAAIEDPALWGPTPGVLPLLGVAVAWPAPVDRLKRPGGQALHDRTWRRRDPATRAIPTLPERTAAAFGDPFTPDRCHALNDVSAQALAIAFEDTRKRAYDPNEDQWKIALVIRVGGGLGSSMVVLAPHAQRRLSFIDALLIEGTNGFAGEIGHLRVDKSLIDTVNRAQELEDLAPMPYGRWRCSCRRLHHLESFASSTALVRRLQASGVAVPADDRRRTSFIRAGLADDPDELLIEAVRDVGRLLGRALTGPILMLDPHRITFTGSLATRYLVDGMRRERDAWANAISDSVGLAHREGDAGAFAGVHGAALAVVRRHVYRRFLDDGFRPPTLPFGSEQMARLTVSPR